MSGVSRPARRTLWSCLALAMFMLACATPALAAPKELRGLLIRPKRNTTPHAGTGVPKFLRDLIDSDLTAQLFDLGFSRLKSVGSHGFYSLKWDSIDDVLGGIVGDTVEVALPVLQKTLGALGLEVRPDYAVRMSAVPDDAMWSSISTTMAQIGATTAWETTTGSTNIKVCVIDSGIQYTHPDLAANMPEQLVYDAIANSVTTNTSNDGDGHGTHVAGTIGAVGNNAQGVAGVNWAANMIGCKFLGSDGSGTWSDAIECIRWCREQGSWITSNSWGASANIDLVADAPGLLEEMQAAEDAGMLFVAAAGNEATNQDEVDSGPADFNLASVISVGAVDSLDQIASFSNYGRRSVHLFAPGVDITSTVPNDTYTTYSGTSMACPHVTGAAALLWGYAPGAYFYQIKQAIMEGVDVVAGATESISGGRLNVANALEQLIRPVDPTPPPPPSVAPPPPSSGAGCIDQAPADLCSQWASLGYCDGTHVAHGQLVYALCPSTCNSCGRCEDLNEACPSYAEQGYCPYYTSDGYSISNVLCRKSCLSCDGLQISPLSLQLLDISGVWITTDGEPNVYIHASPEAGTGIALWLENPPQELRLQSQGNNTWLATDVQGGQYKIAAVEGDSRQLAGSLVVGEADQAVTWTRNTSVTVGLRKYKTQPGDTLDSIAGQFSTTADELTLLNPFLLINNSTLPTILPLVLPGSNFDGVSRLFSFSQSIAERQASAASTSLPRGLRLML